MYTYKPGYTIEIHEAGPTFYVTIRGKEPDAWGGDRPVAVVYTQGYNYCVDPDWAVRETVRKFEMHEVDEWLRKDGERLRTPHGPGVDPDPG